MARNSGTQLTKYISTTTIVTADVANMWFGGLYGTSDGDAYDVDDPIVAGHVHDGSHKDGHAQKVNLVEHVTSQLRNSNLADNAVIKRNIQSFLDQGSAIPEFEMIDGDKYYYLDLSDLRSEITGGSGAFETIANVTSNSPGNLTADDLVFGSDSLNHDGNTNHYARMFFDKSKAAFRAGSVDDTYWDEVNIGSGSSAFGRNTTASGPRTMVSGDANIASTAATNSVITGGNNNITSAIGTFIGAGSGNTVSSNATNSAIVAGKSNLIESFATTSVVVSGDNNKIKATSPSGFIGGGSYNTIDGVIAAYLGGGTDNTIGDNSVLSSYSVISGGNANTIIGLESFIGGGTNNQLTGAQSVITGGKDNVASDTSDYVFMGGGRGNITSGDYQVTAGGENNSIGTSSHAIITGGDGNIITSSGGGSAYAFIGGGRNNLIDGKSTESPFNVISGGEDNTVTAGSSLFASHNVIGGGDTNTVTEASFSVISGGFKNRITAPTVGFNPHSYSVIRGGAQNSIGVAGSFSDVGGVGGRGYMYNQFAVGGGYWSADTDANGDPTPFGQAQTSLVIAGTEVTSFDTSTQMYLDLITSSNTLYVPDNHSVFCEVSIIARDSTSVSEVAARKYYFAIRREAGLSSAIIADQSDNTDLSADGMLATVAMVPGALGAITPEVSIKSSGSTTLPVRAVAKIEWTQVYLG